ncbi:MAG: hypothetical protein J6P44_05845 [Bacteroidales bacterium]|nr:hypothetical protein [Bacteroidales bacterium]
MKIFIQLFILFISGIFTSVYPQNNLKTELKDFDFVVHEIEHNYSGYAFKVKGDNKRKYRNLKKSLRKQIIKENRNGVDAASELVGWFNDLHFSLGSVDFHSGNYMTKKHKDYSLLIKDYNPQFVASKVTDKTFLIRIPHYAHTDSVKNFIDGAVNQFKQSGCKNLIIDERKNPGGSSDMFMPLVYLAADHCGQFYSYKWLNTKDNRNFIDTSWREEYPELTQKIVAQMDASKDKYVVMDNDSLYTIDSINTSPLPENIAVIIDNNVASSGEFLIVFLNACSNRFKVYGKENTIGCLDFANAKRMILPSRRGGMNVPVTCPVFDNFIDNTGIAPEVIIPLDYPEQLTDNIDSWVIWTAKDMESNSR